MTMMRKAPTFRTRLMLLAAGMGLTLSLIFAVSAVWIAERYEHLIVSALLQQQANTAAQEKLRDPRAVLPANIHLEDPHGKSDLPDRLARLPPGIHEAEGDDGWHVGVFDTRAGRVYVETELADIEKLERYLLGVMLSVVAIGALLSAVLGWWLARSATRPLRRLARAVEALSSTPCITTLAQQQPRDELGRLAQAIDAYQRRLVEAKQTERAFFADASHELRTPVAVMRGALELLEEDAQSQPDMQRPLQRLRRGVDETSSLLEALLRLARLEPGQATWVDVDVDAWARDFLASSLRQRAPAISLTMQGAGGTRRLPQRDAELVIAALLGVLLAKPAAGHLTASLTAHGIRLHLQPQNATTSPQARPGDAAQRSDRRAGSNLIERLAQAHGWRIRFDDEHSASLEWQAD